MSDKAEMVSVEWAQAGSPCHELSWHMLADSDGVEIYGLSGTRNPPKSVLIRTDDENNLYDVIDSFISSLQALRAKAKESGL